ncbi:hypothetical protein H4R99_004400 [Coemansia sp. RSA 1722]|nr:hypothetical protein LPJ57_008269 [Coemansia sp. RSA 486]KAJ2232002.1 hypothetical protein IWW45_005293 [Coemansia sp. RSA 485]KAJ2597705.1 hypothetical protein H4R99_004400 [Coemansia sp. RSA 1722]
MSSSSSQQKTPWDRSTKYWCQYCQIFVHDNKSSRRLHDTGAKHKDNVQKYLRQIDKGVREKQETEAKLRSELEKIERAATASYNKDIGSIEAQAVAEPEKVESAKNTADAENQYQEVDQNQDSSKPDNIGVIGAWEVVENPDPEPEIESSVARDTDNVDRSGSEPSKFGIAHNARIDEDQGSGGFDIKEKTVTSVQAHFKRGPDNDEVSQADPQAATAGSLFKKRRSASNRNNARKRIGKPNQ